MRDGYNGMRDCYRGTWDCYNGMWDCYNVTRVANSFRKQQQPAESIKYQEYISDYCNTLSEHCNNLSDHCNNLLYQCNNLSDLCNNLLDNSNNLLDHYNILSDHYNNHSDNCNNLYGHCNNLLYKQHTCGLSLLPQHVRFMQLRSPFLLAMAPTVYPCVFSKCPLVPNFLSNSLNFLVIICFLSLFLLSVTPFAVWLQVWLMISFGNMAHLVALYAVVL